MKKLLVFAVIVFAVFLSSCDTDEIHEITLTNDTDFDIDVSAIDEMTNIRVYKKLKAREIDLTDPLNPVVTERYSTNFYLQNGSNWIFAKGDPGIGAEESGPILKYVYGNASYVISHENGKFKAD